jgi:predicted TIM-barrel fold metal-dependent hydrolase
MIDHHAHAVLRDTATLPVERYRRCFSESDDPAEVEHVPKTLSYRLALRLLAEHLGCADGEAAVLEARSRLGTEGLIRSLFADLGLGTVLVDTGYAPSGEILSPAALGRAGNVRVFPVCRIETLAESFVPDSESFEHFTERVRVAFGRLRAEGYVAMKSIIAYRSGLRVRRVEVEDARSAWRRARGGAGTQRVRLEDASLLHWVLMLALEACVQQSLPLQFHAGFGDRDVDLPQADPTLLRELLQDGRYRGVPLILLHNYPFLRQAGYLASLYSNVYVDVSLAIPLAGVAARRVLEEVLELAPTSKLLYASDGHTIPDLFWLAGSFMKRALHETVADLVSARVLKAMESEEVIAAILRDNAERIYRLREEHSER